MKRILDKIKQSYKQILKDNLVGIYLHGSYVLDCFNEKTSDLDFIVVVNEMLTHEEKMALVDVLLHLDKVCAKGFEMSVVLKRYCTYFQYPTPYELHFSQMYEDYYRHSLSGMCHRMHGLDYDLATHFKMIQTKGKVLIGKEIGEVFGCIDDHDLFDSLDRDIQESVGKLDCYDTILNMCRFAYYLYDNSLVSKKEGALWALSYFDECYESVIQKALDAYMNQSAFHLSKKELDDWLDLMKECGVLL